VVRYGVGRSRADIGENSASSIDLCVVISDSPGRALGRSRRAPGIPGTVAQQAQPQQPHQREVEGAVGF
jgi:hypothetical protein